MPEEIESTYSTCAKCGVHHSNLVKHRCFKQDEAPPPPESKGGDGDSDQLGDDQVEGEGQGEGDGEGEGEGEGQGQPEGEGEGEAEGEGDGDGDGEREAPVPQQPEPEAPPVAVVVTVLKFAALTAQCAKNGNIEVTLTADGLFVYGHNGEDTATATIPWTEFEQRSTIDGEFYVKQVIDEIDRAMADPGSDERKLAAMIAEAREKREAKAKAKAEAPTEEAPKKARGKRKAA